MQITEKPLSEKLHDLQMYALDAAETPLDASYDAAIKVYCNTEDSEIKEKAKKVLKMQAENKVLLSSGESYIDMSKDLIEMGAKQVLIN